VLKRLLLLTAALASVVLNGRELRAALVDVQLYPLSGEVRLFNPNPTPFEFVYYELKSGANAFIAPASWTSIADTYDSSGNGFIDPVNQWIELSATSSMLAEGLFIGSGSALPAYRSIGLGAVWGPEVSMPNDVDATVLDGNSQFVPVNVYISLAGDYNRDLVVDASDYTVWRNEFGSVASPYADGNFDGMVDAADYMVWRNNFGLSLVGSGYGSLKNTGSIGGGFAAAVPEPASVLLASCAGFGLTLRRRPRKAVASV